MPWQRQVADVGLELLPDGRPAFRKVIATVPRQSGKTLLILAWELQRALGWAQVLGERQRIVYSAQTGKDAREKLVEDQFPLLGQHDPARKQLLGIRDLRIANGSEGVVWKNGSRLGLMGGTESSGHGKTVDLAIKDELFHDVDFRRDQTLNPAMMTRAHAQMVTASTMGTADSVALNSEVNTGRAAVDEHKTTGVAYFEWSASDDDDPGDPATWWRCMPALGRTVTLEVVEADYATMPLEEFKRAYLNVPTAAEDRVIPQSAWNAVCDDNVEATAELMAVDVNPERTAAAIVAVGPGPIIEVVDYRPGIAWVVPRCAELRDRYHVRFAVDKTGPVASLIDELRRSRVRLVEFDGDTMKRASGAFYDAVMGGAVRIRRNLDLDAAVAGAAKRPVVDAWTWGRKTSKKVDISPLVAATVGLWAFNAKSKPKVVSMADRIAQLEGDTDG